jgi:hypothetical protein
MLRHPPTVAYTPRTRHPLGTQVAGVAGSPGTVGSA